MRWLGEFLLGAGFWFGVIYYMSEVAQIGPGDDPPRIAMGVMFAVALGRAMTYLQRSDRRLGLFALCHLLAAVAGIGLGITLFPPEQLAG